MSTGYYSIMSRSAAISLLNAAAYELVKSGAPAQLVRQLQEELGDKPLVDASAFSAWRTHSVAVLRSGLDPVLTGLIYRTSVDGGQTWVARKVARFSTLISVTV